MEDRYHRCTAMFPVCGSACWCITRGSRPQQFRSSVAELSRITPPTERCVSILNRRMEGSGLSCHPGPDHRAPRTAVMFPGRPGPAQTGHCLSDVHSLHVSHVMGSSLSLPFTLSVCLSVCLSSSRSPGPSVCLCLSVCLSVSACLSLSVSVSACLSVCLSGFASYTCPVSSQFCRSLATGDPIVNAGNLGQAKACPSSAVPAAL